MSNIVDMGLDLENLFQPAWAQGKSESNRFEKFTGEEGVRPERRRGEGFGERRDRGPRRDGAPGGDRRGGESRGPRPGGFGGGKMGDRKGGPRRDGGRQGSFPGNRPDERRAPVEAPEPLPELNVAFIPEEKGVEQLARQIRMTGRAYPLFQIAQLILQKPERYSVQLTSKKKADGTVAQSIYVCALDDTPWISEEEAVAHVLKHHFATFYQAEKTPCDPPKGVYTFVAQCGMSGVILGPPNYHDYQNQLRKLHTERFARMPFEVFKSRVKIVRDEAVVKKWIEEQSAKTEYNCLNVAEPLKLASLEEVEKHFRSVHKDAIIKPVESYTVAGVPSRTLKSSGLQRLVRQEWEHQRYFPLPIATKLSQQFASHGLQFFKVNKTVTHVSVARPQYLDIQSTPVSDGIRRILNYINDNPKATRKKLVEALAPTPKASPAAAPAAPAPVVAAVENAAVTAESPAAAATAPAEAGATTESTSPAPAAKAAPAATDPTPEQTAVMLDLHWLIHQGAVLEFADGRMETAKKPLPKPPKPAAKPKDAKPAGKPEEATSGSAETATESTEAIAEGEPAEDEVEPAAEATPAQSEPAATPAPAAGSATPAAEPAALNEATAASEAPTA
jgi:hypothetical protein